MRKHVRLAFVIFSSAALSACANLSAGNLFSHYSAQNSDVYQSVKDGEYQKAEEALPENVAGDILDNFEKGRVYLLNQQYADSKSAFEAGDKAVRVQQDKATISLTETATSVAALAVNDNLDIYEPADYELGFLHLYLGLNYLRENSLEGALIEMRRANQVQEQARKAREKELESAQKDMQSQGLTPNLGSVLSSYPDAGKTLQAIQNGYLLYLSALLYEADNSLNDSYVDYRRALAVMPDNTQVIEGTKRVAKRLGMSEDLVQLEKRYGKASYLGTDEARVIVIEEQGVVEAMQGWKQSLPLYDSSGNGALYSIALPYYPQQVSQSFVSMQLNNENLQSDLLTDVNLMAERDLSERMPAIIIRQALRVWAKDEIRKSAAKDDELGNALLNIWNTLTEQPDTRSWITLPREIRSSSAVVQPGTQVIRVAGQDYKFDVEEGRTALVWVSRQGVSATIWHKQLGKIR
ncbi:lipoprotein [Vibrio neptunius]|uniref:COG3014 family protein n=1 Tax=Vibrio neptunius TaxID=170651 RepID=UPI0005F9E85A|nr:lipoprotein [Vibrio neptunius]KJY93229.1 lipoprotein [Vibrio neptunius]